MQTVCDDCNVTKRVLIVDDHEPFRAVARELLERGGFVVAGEAADAAGALAAVRAKRPTPCCSTCSFPTTTVSRSRGR